MSSKTLSTKVPTLDTFNPVTGEVKTVVVGKSPEQRRQEAKKEGSKSARVERQAEKPVTVAKSEQTTSIAKVPYTYNTIKTSKDLIDGMQDLGVYPKGVYVQKDNGVRTLYFTMTKLVPKNGIVKDTYLPGETKTVYLCAKLTEYGDVTFYGERNGLTKSQLDAHLTMCELASNADMQIVDMKAQAARRDGKVTHVAPVQIAETEYTFDVDAITTI